MRLEATLALALTDGNADLTDGPAAPGAWLQERYAAAVAWAAQTALAAHGRFNSSGLRVRAPAVAALDAANASGWSFAWNTSAARWRAVVGGGRSSSSGSNSSSRSNSSSGYAATATNASSSTPSLTPTFQPQQRRRRRLDDGARTVLVEASFEVLVSLAAVGAGSAGELRGAAAAALASAVADGTFAAALLDSCECTGRRDSFFFKKKITLRWFDNDEKTRVPQ